MLNEIFEYHGFSGSELRVWQNTIRWLPLVLFPPTLSVPHGRQREKSVLCVHKYMRKKKPNVLCAPRFHSFQNGERDVNWFIPVTRHRELFYLDKGE